MSGSATLERTRPDVPPDGASAPLPGYDAAGRPTRALPIPQLVRLSLYWLGLSSIWAGMQQIIEGRIEFGHLVPAGQAGSAYAQMNLLGTIAAIVVQPTVATISDYTISRWGRRKPYIVIGSVLDLVFLFGIASSNTVVTIAAFILLLQVSSNTAQGPFQGYIPDLVPEKQVGLASSLMGLFQTFGNITGYVVAIAAVSQHAYGLGLMIVGAVEFVTMLSVVLRVQEGRAPKPREGRSWPSIAREAWGSDILRERSYLWLVGSRFFILTAGSAILAFASTFYLNRVFGMDETQWLPRLAVGGVLVVGTALSVVPAGRLSDRVGRKPVIYASCAAGVVGMSLIAAAPIFVVAAAGVVFVGVSAGAFLAVDWALMTDIIPKASSGRYMGISNLATGSAGQVMAMVGGVVMDAMGAALGLATGVRLVFAVCVVLYVVGALLLVPVDPRPRLEAAEA